VHAYPGINPWEAFLDGIENLPSDIRVIGINDYLFIDGYRKVLEARAAGRLKNIDTVLPVVELRLNVFGGTIGALSRVNFHVIFSDEVPADVIQQQFLNALSRNYALSPPCAAGSVGTDWGGVVTRESLVELGKKVIETVPLEERARFQSPIMEGFNNLCLTAESIHGALDNHHFRNKFLTAVGKTEWADVKWNDHSIAEKKSLINSVDLVFMSAETAAHCLRAKESLTASNVNNRLLDCSDAHALASHKSKDRLGKCYTWIKSTPTFAGLKHAIRNDVRRIVVGNQPRVIQYVRENADRYLDRITFHRTANAKPNAKWFSGTVLLNPGLVAIIGNKGSGKSALADVIANIGKSTAVGSFSFLHADKFLQPKHGLAAMFECEFAWLGGSPVRTPLTPHSSSPESEAIKYIPQNYLESICTELRWGTESAFYRELREVIFSHVDRPRRQGKASLDELIEHLTQDKSARIRQYVTELGECHRRLAQFEERATVEHRTVLEGRLKQFAQQLDSHDKAPPEEVPIPDEDPETKAQNALITVRLDALVEEAQRLDEQLELRRTKLDVATRRMTAADRLLGRVNNIRRAIDIFYAESEPDCALLGIDVRALLAVDYRIEQVRNARAMASDAITALTAELSAEAPNSPAADRVALSHKIANVRGQLAAPQQKYQQYLHARAQWEKRRESIIGSSDVADSVRGVEAALQALDKLPDLIAEERAKRDKAVAGIYDAKADLLSDYQRLFAPVQEFIEKHPIAQRYGGLEFVATIAEEGFVEEFVSNIHKGKRGSFQGDAEGRLRAREAVSRADFGSLAGVRDFLTRFEFALRHDLREESQPPMRIASQLIQGRTQDRVLNYLFGLEYLKPRFELRWQSKPLEQLSPGERGALLLVFYLLIDKRKYPLVIDQPEENLDNKTITNLLVPAIQHAKELRQIIIVTHNPNLAVVCDADQVIHATIDKSDGNKVTYRSGSVEDAVITRQIVDVLEGTKPAFDQRDATYCVLDF